MSEISLKIGDLLLIITSPVLATLTRFLARTFNGSFNLYTFCHSSYIFRIIIHLQIDKRFPQLALKPTPKCNFWGLNGAEYWIFFFAESLQLKEEVKFQSYILSFLFLFLFLFFLFCFHWKAIYENAYKGLHKSIENHWNLFIKVNFFYRL